MEDFYWTQCSINLKLPKPDNIYNLSGTVDMLNVWSSGMWLLYVLAEPDM